MLGQAFTAVTGRSATGFEDYIQFLSNSLSEVFGTNFFQDPLNRKKRSMDDAGDAKMFSELKDTAESMLKNVNISSMTELFNVDNLELGGGNLPPGSVLSLASVIGNTHHGSISFLTNVSFRYGNDCSIYLYWRRK